MLIDVWQEVGLAGIAQVDLDEHRNRHQPLSALSPMAETVLADDRPAARARRPAEAAWSAELRAERPPLVERPIALSGRARCLYLDLDGTLLGRGASLLHDGDGGVSIEGVRAVQACLRAGVEVVLMSGRRRARSPRTRACWASPRTSSRRARAWCSTARSTG